MSAIRSLCSSSLRSRIAENSSLRELSSGPNSSTSTLSSSLGFEPLSGSVWGTFTSNSRALSKIANALSGVIVRIGREGSLDWLEMLMFNSIPNFINLNTRNLDLFHHFKELIGHHPVSIAIEGETSWPIKHYLCVSTKLQDYRN